MRFTIDTERIKDSDMSISEFFYLLACYFECPIVKDTYKNLHLKDYIYCVGLDDEKQYDRFCITPKGVEAVNGVFADTEIADKKVISKFDILAEKLINLYPSGRKEGTHYLWRDSKLSISRRLKTLYTKYGVNFTEDQAVEATKNYIKSFNGNYKTMRLLKYFIYKIEVKDGKEEFTSELAAMIENKDNLESYREDWLNTLA